MLGVIGALIELTSYQLKRGKAILALMALGNCFWAAHYLLLGSLGGMVASVMSIFKNLSATWVAEKFLKWIALVSIAALIPLFFIKEVDSVLILAFLASTSGSFSLIFRERTLIMRTLSAVCCAFWIAHGVLIDSYPAMVHQSLFIISIAVGALRHEPALKRLKIGRMKQ